MDRLARSEFANITNHLRKLHAEMSGRGHSPEMRASGNACHIRYNRGALERLNERQEPTPYGGNKAEWVEEMRVVKNRLQTPDPAPEATATVRADLLWRALRNLKVTVGQPLVYLVIRGGVLYILGREDGKEEIPVPDATGDAFIKVDGVVLRDAARVEERREIKIAIGSARWQMVSNRLSPALTRYYYGFRRAVVISGPGWRSSVYGYTPVPLDYTYAFKHMGKAAPVGDYYLTQWRDFVGDQG